MRARERRHIPNRYHGTALRRRRGARYLWLCLGLVAVALLAGTVLALSLETADWVSDSPFLRVRGVEVRGQRLLTAAQVQDWIGAQVGAPLLEIEPAALAARLREHPRVRNAWVSRGADRRLHVVVEERRSRALVLAGTLVEVDADGVVLPPLAGCGLPDLPILTGSSTRLPVPGELLVQPAVRRTLELLERLEDRDTAFVMRIAEIDLHQAPLLSVLLIGSGHVLTGHFDSFTPEKLDALHAVLEDLDRRDLRGLQIDLRFEGQLVTSPVHQLVATGR